MNDKDKESFLKVGDALIYPEKFLSNPIGVCSYQAFYEIEKLQVENAKLRECVEFYANFQNWEGREIDGNDWHDFYEDGNGIGGKRAIEFIRGKNK